MKTVTRSTTFSLIPLLPQVDALVERFQHMRRTRPDGSCILVGKKRRLVLVAFFFSSGKNEGRHRLKLYTNCLQRLCVCLQIIMPLLFNHIENVKVRISTDR